jgi:hypothetical protein
LVNTSVLTKSCHEADDIVMSLMTSIRCHSRRAGEARHGEVGLGFGLLRGEVSAGILRCSGGAIYVGHSNTGVLSWR